MGVDLTLLPLDYESNNHGSAFSRLSNQITGREHEVINTSASKAGCERGS